MASKNSHSSKTFAYDASLLLPVSRPIGGGLHESSSIQSNAFRKAPFILQDTSSSVESNSAVGSNASSIIADRSSLRMDKAVMQSCWIQRLQPTCQASAFEEAEQTETSHVWTHFTKDFSSCSKRLRKAHNHAHSSSWPPYERTSKYSPLSDLKLVEPVHTKAQYLLSRATLPELREENFCVPFQHASEIYDFYSKSGNTFSHQNSRFKSVSTSEALVPCSNAGRTSDDFQTGESKDEVNLKNFASQRLNPKFSKESGSHLEPRSARVKGDTPFEGNFVVSELAQTTAHMRGSSPDAVIRTSLSPALKGASADADVTIKGVYLSRPSKPHVNRPAVVFGDTKNKITEDGLGSVIKKCPGKVFGKEMKTQQNFGFLHVAGQSKMLNQLRANPCKCNGLCDRGCSHKVGGCNRGSGAMTGSELNKRTQNFGTFAANAGPSVTKKSDDFLFFNIDLIRAGCRETRLDECWMQLFEGSGPLKYFDMGYPLATRHQEHVTDEGHGFSFNSPANIWKPDQKMKRKSYPEPSSCIPLNNNDQIYNSCDLPQQTQASLGSSFIQTKQPALGRIQGASVSRSPLERISILKTWQEENLQGGRRGLTSKTGKKELICDDVRTTQLSGVNEAWIRRWQSSSNFMAIPGKTLSASLGLDKELGSAPAKVPIIRSYKGEKDRDCVDGNFIEPTRTIELHMDGSARHYDYGFGATARSSFPVYNSHTSLRGKYMAPSVEAMAIVGNTASKLHHSTLENRGFFSVWPCPSVQHSQKRSLLGPRETVEDNMHDACSRYG